MKILLLTMSVIITRISDIVTTVIKSGWKSIAGKHAIYVQVSVTQAINNKHHNSRVQTCLVCVLTIYLFQTKRLSSRILS